MKKLCLIIPTKDRPFELERLFNSMVAQDILPEQIIVVDGGDPGIKPVIEKFPQLPIDYLQVLPPGLTRQRNAGLKKVRDNIDLVGFLDDDIVFQDNCMKNMLDFWEEAGEDVAGAGFNIIDHPPEGKPKWLEFLFKSSLKDKPAGAVLKVGRNVPYCPAPRTSETKWLCGGATVWRKKTYDTFEYDEWFAGYGIVEDVDFSYRVSKENRLFVVAEAQVRHIETPKKNHYLLGYIVTMNHMYVAKKHDEFSYPMCILYFAANGIISLLFGLVQRDRNRMQKGMGIINAVLRGSILGIARVKKQVKDKK